MRVNSTKSKESETITSEDRRSKMDGNAMGMQQKLTRFLKQIPRLQWSCKHEVLGGNLDSHKN